MVKLVVDTNILFSFFWRGSLTRKLLINSDFELVSPKFALVELKKYSKEIIKKTKITKREFEKELLNLQKVVSFIDKKKYSYFLKAVEVFSPDKDDADFFALCLFFDCSLWSNDSLLQSQEKVEVFSTEEIIEVLF